MRGSSREYKFGTKNNWRRWLWNRILERTTGRERMQPILYLAGPGDYDRSVAVAKGVPTQNLIAIDDCRDNIQRVKAQGVPAVHADVFQVLQNWPSKRQVAGVVLDLCGGLQSRYFVDLGYALLRQPFHHCVVAVNFQRGRDAETNWIRSDEELMDASFKTFTSGAIGSIANPEIAVSPKNRAIQWLGLLTTGLLEGHQLRGADQVAVRKWLDAWMSSIDPFFYSYHSGPLVFDSVVYNSHFQCASDDEDLERNFQPNEPLRRTLSATLAVRTTRIANAGGRV